LSNSCKAADKFQTPLAKDNPLLTCPALLLCSQMANAIPDVLGGSFFFVHDKKQENENLCEAEKIAENWQGMTFT
jgi:hypothetical protein